MTAVYIFLVVIAALAVLVLFTPKFMSDHAVDRDEDAEEAEARIAAIKEATNPAPLERPHVTSKNYWSEQ